ELDAQTMFLLRIKREDLQFAKSWHGLTALEKELRWGIFTTKITAVNLREKLHGETDLHKILAELTMGNITNSSSQVWKREGLRALDDEEDEKELEADELEEVRDIDVLIRKRKLEINENAAEIS